MPAVFYHLAYFQIHFCYVLKIISQTFQVSYFRYINDHGISMEQNQDALMTNYSN